MTLCKLEDIGCSAIAQRHGNGIKEGYVIGQTIIAEPGDAYFTQAFRQDLGEEMNAFGDSAQTFRAVIAGIRAGDVSQQSLGGADVASGFFPADVLLACLQGKPQRWTA